MKKKAVAAAWVFAVSLVALFTTINNAEANTPLLDRSLSLQDLASQLNSPKAVADYLWKHFVFEDDQRLFGREDYWQTPSEFMSRKKGDCEDFASLAGQILKLQGIESFILNIYGSRSGHTICVFKQNGRYHAIDGSSFKKYGADTLQQVIEKTNPDWEKAAIVVLNEASHRGQIVAEIKR